MGQAGWGRGMVKCEILQQRREGVKNIEKKRDIIYEQTIDYHHNQNSYILETFQTFIAFKKILCISINEQFNLLQRLAFCYMAENVKNLVQNINNKYLKTIFSNLH